LHAFPAGLTPPRKVRVYRRREHFLLQWWEPAAKKNLTERVDGDLLAALSRARQLDERLQCARTTGKVGTRVSHEALAEQFLRDLERRADAQELSPVTPRRYRSALAGYLQFCAQPGTARSFPYPVNVNREFRLAFVQYLAGRDELAPPAGMRRGRGDARYVLDVARAMYRWGADPDLGRLLPEDFRNPFLRSQMGLAWPSRDPLAPPDITSAMAGAFLRSCDLPQLRLFVPIVLFGLRASEPCFLFHEHVVGEWLLAPNLPELAYQTKGKREKRFPLLPELAPFWRLLHLESQTGLLYSRGTGACEAPHTLGGLAALFAARVRRAGSPGAAARRALRDEVLRGAGGIDYDFIEGEFGKIARGLGWPPQATLKDFRHHFCTMLTNAGVPEVYRRYLLGHALGRDAILNYTHLDELQRHYRRAVTTEWASLFEVIRDRTDALTSGRPPVARPA
jgi:hypothetical protein